MNNFDQKTLVDLANQILRKAGFDANAAPIGMKSESVKTIGTPMGGANSYRRRSKRRP